MRVVAVTNHIPEGEAAVQFATAMNLYDETFAARYFRREKDVGQSFTRRVAGEAHFESDKYDMYYLGVKDPEGFLACCRAMPACRMMAIVDHRYKVVGEPLYVNESFLRNQFFKQANGTIQVPRNILERPASFRPLEPQARVPSPV